MRIAPAGEVSWPRLTPQVDVAAISAPAIHQRTSPRPPSRRSGQPPRSVDKSAGADPRHPVATPAPAACRSVHNLKLMSAPSPNHVHVEQESLLSLRPTASGLQHTARMRP